MFLKSAIAITLGILAFESTAVAAQCVGSKKPCLSMSAMPVGFRSYFAKGDPCFPLWGGNWCFTSTSGSLGKCSCSDSACGCGKVPVDHCTNEGVDMTPSCTADKEKYCAADYDWNGSKSTKCLYCGVDVEKCNNKVCTVGITKEEDKQLIVDVHNKLRREVALGQVTEGDPGPQPKAADMLELTWSDELASWAQLWVEQCFGEHDKNRDILPGADGWTGQNRYDNWKSWYTPDRNYTLFVEAWFNEVKDWPASRVPKYEPTTAVTGHYTQVVWGKTQQVGCGFIAWKSTDNYPYRQAFVCNYFPGGNWYGQPMYIEGTPASECPTGTTADNGLCKSS